MKSVRKVLIGGGIVSTLVLGSSIAVSIRDIPDHLTLKASPQFIVDYKVYTTVLQESSPTTTAIFVDEVKYAFLSGRPYQLKHGEDADLGSNFSITKVSGVDKQGRVLGEVKIDGQTKKRVEETFFEEAVRIRVRDDLGDYYWMELEYATTTLEAFNKQFGKLGVVWWRSILAERAFAQTGTFYPDPDAESTSVDGRVRRTSTNSTFTSIRTNAGTSFTDSAVTSECLLVANASTASRYDENARSVFLFDTSSLPDDASISSAVLSLYATNKNDGFGGASSVSIVKPNPASNTALASTDYNIANWDMTKQATDLTVASISTGAYNDWTLNATGISNISKTGVTDLGCANNWDQSATAPSWVANERGGMAMSTADEAGTSQDPKLVITYTSSGGSDPDELEMGKWLLLF